MAQRGFLAEKSFLLENEGTTNFQLIHGDGEPSGLPSTFSLEHNDLIGTVYVDTTNGEHYILKSIAPATWVRTSGDVDKIIDDDTYVKVEDLGTGDSKSRILFYIDGSEVGEWDGNRLSITGEIHADGGLYQTNSEEVNIGDSFLRLNADLLSGGEDAGISAKRVGTAESLSYTSITAAGSPQNQLDVVLSSALSFTLTIDDVIQIASSSDGNDGMYYISSLTSQTQFTLTAISDISTSDETGSPTIANVSDTEANFYWDESASSWTSTEDLLVQDDKNLFLGTDKDWYIKYNSGADLIELKDSADDGITIETFSNNTIIKPAGDGEDIIFSTYDGYTLLTVDEDGGASGMGAIILQDEARLSTTYTLTEDTQITHKKYVDDLVEDAIYKTSGSHTGGSITVCDSVPVPGQTDAVYGVSWVISVDDGSGFYGRTVVEAIASTTSEDWTNFAVLRIGSAPAGLQFDVDNDGTNLRLRLYTTSTNLTYRVVRITDN